MDLVIAGLRRGIENAPSLRAKSPRLLTPRLPGATTRRNIPAYVIVTARLFSFHPILRHCLFCAHAASLCSGVPQAPETRGCDVSATKKAAEAALSSAAALAGQFVVETGRAA